MRGVSNGRRFIAYIIDFIIVQIILSPLSGIGKITDFEEFMVNLEVGNVILISILTALVTVLYWVILEYKIQQTAGGAIMKMKVKGKLNFYSIIIRNLTKVSTGLLLIDSIGLIKNKQRFTERWSGTYLTNEKG